MSAEEATMEENEKGKGLLLLLLFDESMCEQEGRGGGEE